MKKEKKHRSLFFHLVWILILITLLINISVFSFFRHHGPPSKIPLGAHIDKYVNFLSEEIGNPPDESKAKDLSRELKIGISFTGKYKTWSTDLNIPPLKELEKDFQNHKKWGPSGKFRRAGHYKGGFYKIVAVKDGSLVFWLQGPDWLSHPTRNILGLILFFSLVIFLAGWLVKRLLMPIKEMEKSFSSVSMGNLNTKLSLKKGPREFLSTADGFNHMVSRISQMISEKDRLLRDMSHEFRSPLARMKLAVDLLSDSDEKKDLNEDILELENLVKDILDAYRYSYFEENKKNNTILKKENFDLVEVISSLVDKIKKSDNKIIIQEKYRSPVNFTGDKEKIKRLLRNLLENAVKYSPPGEITGIEVKKEAKRIIIIISDNGPGIPDSEKEKIFEPFYRLEASRTPGSGYGLGLFLSREIALLHHGEIFVRKNHPRGSIFEVHLPESI